MPKMTVEVRTDENGYFCKTVSFHPSGPAIRLSVTLLSPHATGVWGTLDIDTKISDRANQPRAFVVWHSETVQLGPWRLDGGEHIIVVTGKTKPSRANARLLLEIEAAA